jgi:UPF0755 protein
MWKKIPKLFLFIITVLLFLSLAAFSFASLFQARSNIADPVSVRFVIPRGQALSIIATRLEEAGLIKNAYAFRFVVYQKQLANKIQAGSFELSPSMDTWQIATALTVGTDDIWLTLPEGWRREEIAESLAKQELPNFDAAEFLTLTKGLEGQLFPDTYLVSRETSTAQIVSLLRNTFESKVLTGLSAQISASELSLNEILTLASLVQRESANDAEMPLVAQILLNRLAINMALQVDATLQYVKGYSQVESSWWSTPLAVDKSLDSLYNTYKYPNLPPAPIANSGLAAIKAVLAPRPTKALYYIHDTSGQIHTAETLDGHNANVNKYLR